MKDILLQPISIATRIGKWCTLSVKFQNFCQGEKAWEDANIWIDEYDSKARSNDYVEIRVEISLSNELYIFIYLYIYVSDKLDAPMS